jgi:hypothetical protein
MAYAPEQKGYFPMGFGPADVQRKGYSPMGFGPVDAQSVVSVQPQTQSATQQQPSEQQVPAPKKKKESLWPDALIGLSQFMMAMKRNPPEAPTPPSFAGIGQPAVAVQPQLNTAPVPPPGPLGRYL